jgi:hypothetical protein
VQITAGEADVAQQMVVELREVSVGPATFGGPVWITAVIMLIWGATVIPDSAQFSAIVADNAPADLSGSLLAFQTALGFALTIVTVQVTPILAAAFGWPVVLAGLAVGPAFGILAMMPLRRRAMKHGGTIQ